MGQIYIGVDLAWGEKNSSGFCALELKDEKLFIREIKLLQSLEDIITHIASYSNDKVYVGVDAPLLVPNESGNREIEKKFNSDFSKYKIAMLPVNKSLLSKFSPTIRSEELYKNLTELGFERNYNSQKVVFEVYPHSTIAICFNDYKILPYKRKKGRNTAFIKAQLDIYKKYLQGVLQEDIFFDINIDILKGRALKSYEDQLDAITSAYTLYYAKNNSVKYYKLDGIDTFLTPI